MLSFLRAAEAQLQNVADHLEVRAADDPRSLEMLERVTEMIGDLRQYEADMVFGE